MSKQVLKQRPSLESINMAEVTAKEEILLGSDESPTLKHLYSDLMHRLSQDIPDDQVSTVGRKIILEKKRNILSRKKPQLFKNKDITVFYCTEGGSTTYYYHLASTS